MLFGTYQPGFRANFSPEFRQLRDRLLGLSGMGPAPDEDYRGSAPAPLEEITGYRPIWCFPARSLQEALAHGLLTAPNAPDLFFLVESDDYVRVDKAKHYAAIGRGAYGVEDVKACVDPDCPDWRSEFLLPVEALESARLIAFTASGADPLSGSARMPFLFRPPRGKLQTASIPKEIYDVLGSHLSPVKALLDNAVAFVPDGAENAGNEGAEELARLGFMLLVLPVLYGVPFGPGDKVKPDGLIPTRYTAAGLLRCHNEMGAWSYGTCPAGEYERIFRDTWERAAMPEGLMEYMADHGLRLPGRNEACPCGSGRKFKRCHGPLLT